MREDIEAKIQQEGNGIITMEKDIIVNSPLLAAYHIEAVEEGMIEIVNLEENPLEQCHTPKPIPIGP